MSLMGCIERLSEIEYATQKGKLITYLVALSNEDKQIEKGE